MGIPRHTRIIFIPDHGRTREYGISRPMAVTLVGLVFITAGMIAGLMAIFAGRYGERQEIGRLERELAAAQVIAARADTLAAELEGTRQLQEHLLVMLGVDTAPPAAEDSLAVWTASAPGSAGEALRRAAALSLSEGPVNWPAAGYVTREFIQGNQARGVESHPGLDIASAGDTPITAAAAGRVARAGEDQHLGNYVEIEHGFGYLTVYGHCSRLAVAMGDRVETGQIIAYMGATGQATATHLHFEVWRQGEAVDPRSVIAGDPPRN
ncbi:MAG: M23 family metallopeptidase [bacterium]|nr:M23 family metallopeptidase [bacterium]